MDGVNRTLYIPLYGKALVSEKGLFLSDRKAEEIWAAEGFPLKGKAKSKWLAYYMGIRGAVFDRWLAQKMAEYPEAPVIHIGCGLDSRVLRVGTRGHLWYDVDFPQVIAERQRYYQESDCYRMISGDVRDHKWLAEIPESSCAIVVMEGVSMYLNRQELESFARDLGTRFESVALLMDCYTPLAARMSKYKNPVHDVGVTQVFGVEDPQFLEGQGLAYVAERSMTPQDLIEELQGTEKRIFSKLYAGSFSKKLYRLYEYKK